MRNLSRARAPIVPPKGDLSGRAFAKLAGRGEVAEWLKAAPC